MAKIRIKRMNFICFIISIFVINCQNSKSNNDTLVLDFYLDYKIYSLEKSDGNFKIVVYEIIYCKEGSSCPFPIIDEKIIENEEECQILETLFESIFTSSAIKKKKLYFMMKFQILKQI